MTSNTRHWISDKRFIGYVRVLSRLSSKTREPVVRAHSQTQMNSLNVKWQTRSRFYLLAIGKLSIIFMLDFLAHSPTSCVRVCFFCVSVILLMCFVARKAANIASKCEINWLCLKLYVNFFSHFFKHRLLNSIRISYWFALMHFRKMWSFFHSSVPVSFICSSESQRKWYTLL